MPQRREYWTSWFNTDSPNIGIGDTESVSRVESFYGPICRTSGYTIKSAQCTDMVSREIFDQSTSGFAPDILHNPCTVHGLQCVNSDQQSVNGVRQCTDYAIRFRCGYHLGEEAETGFSPQFDVRIYIILAIIPILVFLIRILWSYMFRKRRERREIRNPNSRNSATESESTDDYDLFSIATGLACPPPSYQEIFGEANTSRERTSSVFAIAGRSLLVCAKCDSKPCSIATSINNRTQAQATLINDTDCSESDDQTDSSSLTDSENSTQNTNSDNTQVFSSPRTVDFFSSVNYTDIESQNEEDVGLLISDLQTSRVRTSSQLSEPTDAAQGESHNNVRVENELTTYSSSLEDSSTDSSSTSNEQNQTPLLSPLYASHGHISEPCACTCHRTLSFIDTAVTGYINDSFINEEGPSERRTTHFPGMHSPVPGLQRVWSTISISSIVTQSELPSYEAALEILKIQDADKCKYATTFM